MNLRTKAVAVLLATAGCARAAGRAPTSPGEAPRGVDARIAGEVRSREAEEASVYAAVLLSGSGSDEGTEGTWQVDPARDDGWREADLRGRLPDAPPEARADLRRRRPTREITPPALAPTSIVRFGRAEWDALAGPRASVFERWDAFHRRYPRTHGWFRFSAVGFSHDGTRAIVHVEHSRDGLSGSKAFVLLEKAAGGWRVRERSVVSTA